MRSHSFLIDDPEQVAGLTSSSVQIPARLQQYYLDRCRSLGGRQAYFHFLIRNILPDLQNYSRRLVRAREQKWKTNYQARGQALSKKNFKPLPEDWEALRHLAYAFNVSMCFLFVFLMDQERERPKKNQKNPQKSKSSRGGSSHPRRAANEGKFRKFSKIERRLDFRAHKILKKIHYS